MPSPFRKPLPREERVADAVRTMELRGGADVVEDAHLREEADVLKSARDAADGEVVRLQAGGGFARKAQVARRSADRRR